MAVADRTLSFLWWNLHNFAHYDRARSSDPRWPKGNTEFEAKRDKLLAAFQELFAGEYPDLLAVCEITREAARDLRTRLPGGFDVAIPPAYPRDDLFEVAVFYRAGRGFTAELPLLPFDEEDLSEEARPMMPVHFSVAGHVIRFVGCHWTSFDNKRSQVARERLADVVRRDSHAFLYPETTQVEHTRHLVIVGDLNEEPMSPIFEERLIGSRDRVSSRRIHWRDEQVRRIHLYNAAWRYLGEQVAHGTTPPVAGPAGTFYNARLGWRTFDHLLVSGELLGANPPYLDESRTGIMFTAAMKDHNEFPMAFDPSTGSGVSDHLPIVGRLILPEISR